MLKNKFVKYSLALIAVILITSVVGFLYVNSLFNPVDPQYSGEKVEVIVPSGSTTKNIAGLLKENELIQNELIFQLYVKKYNYDASLKAGKFLLSQDMDMKTIVQVLVEGNTIIDSVRFTIPEGYNVKQIAEKLASEGLVDKERFLQVVKEANFDYEFIKQIPNDKNIEYKLEGYLFPDTYEVRKGATEEEIIEKLLSQFDKEWKEEWGKVAKEKGMTQHELVTMASIVEREVVVDKERPIVAGVFYNRLDDSWNLQSCATVQFILGKQKDTLTFEDLEIQNPYNTYVNQGLPPGPIGNPGRTSLEAVIYPAEHNYFFFVTKKDNSGEHYFSETYEQHLNYDAKSRGNW